MVCATSKGSDQPAHTLEYSMSVKLLTEHHLVFLSLTGGCRGSCESTLVKMSNCWKSPATAHFSLFYFINLFQRATNALCVQSVSNTNTISLFTQDYNVTSIVTTTIPVITSAQCGPPLMHMEHTQSAQLYAPTKASIKEFRLYPALVLRIFVLCKCVGH